MAIGAGFILAAITAFALLAVRRYPYVTIGWLWYLVTLAPVSGLIQVGSHSMADRYTYIPLVGIFIIAVWGVSEMLSRVWRWRELAAFGACALALAIGAVTSYQLQYWSNSEALLRRALAVTGPNGIAENNLATALALRGAYEEALPHALRAVNLRPADEEVVFNMGNIMAGLRRDDEARAWIEKSIEMNPRLEKAYTNLGALLIRQRRFNEAIGRLQTAMGLNPESPVTRLNLAVALAATGRTDEAAARLEEAVTLSPESLLLRTRAVQTWWMMGLRDRAREENNWIRGVDGKLADEIAKWMETQKDVH
jgi:tetratricopeptide (TPR) repeat protein